MKEYQRQLREELEVEEMQKLHEKVPTLHLQQLISRKTKSCIAPMEYY